MLGRTVLYHYDKDRTRVGIVTRVNDDGTVNLSVFADAEDYTFPFDNPVVRFRHVEIGEGNKRCLVLTDSGNEARAARKLGKEKLDESRIGTAGN